MAGTSDDESSFPSLPPPPHLQHEAPHGDHEHHTAEDYGGEVMRSGRGSNDVPMLDLEVRMNNNDEIRYRFVSILSLLRLLSTTFTAKL